MRSPSLSVAPLAAALASLLASPAFAQSVPATAAAAPSADSAADRTPTDLDAVQVTRERIARPTSPKFSEPLLETPQSVTVVPAELMQEQGVTTLRDALRNVPGISMQAGEGGVPAGDNLTLRGFNARTDLFIDGVRDFGGYTRDPFNIEQVEVVKGPASTHAGRGSTGGSINLASKTARMDQFTNATLSAGDDSLLRGTADFNTRLSDSAALRLNLMAHEGEVNGRDAVENSRWGVAPTIAFGLGGDTELHLSLFHLEQDNVPDYGQPWVPASNNVLVESRDARAPVDRELYYGLLDRDYEQTETDMATVELRHAFSDNISLRNLTRWGESRRDSIITAPRFLDDDATTIRRTGKTRDSEDTILTNLTTLNAILHSGAVEHHLVAGLELAREESENRARTVGEEPLTDLLAPDFNDPYTGGIERDPVNDGDASADSIAAYVFDTIELSPMWELSGGLRWDRFEVEATGRDRNSGERETFGRTDNVVSGRAAVVFKPSDNTSLYAGYGTSFNPSAEGLSLNSGTADVAPEKSRTIEIGAKWSLFDDRLLLGSALFRTDKTNARVEDPSREEEGRFFVLDGEQRVEGFEVTVAGEITERLTVFGGYAYLDSEVLSSTDPGEVGNALGNTPRNSATLWGSYQLTDALEFGLGLQHVGSRFSNESNTRMAKAYTTYDMMIGYRLNDAVRLRLNGYNLSDKDYVGTVGGGHYIPGAARTFMLSADLSF
jgi:catecholate siderophore receptor